MNQQTAPPTAWILRIMWKSVMSLHVPPFSLVPFGNRHQIDTKEGRG